MTAAGIGAVPRRSRSVGAQIARGVGFTIALLAGLYAIAYAGTVLFLVNDDAFGSRLHANWPAIAPTAIVTFASLVLCHRARSWSARPGWLIPCGAAVVISSLVIAFAPFPVTGFYFGGGTTCAAIADAWRPVMPKPSPVDLKLWTDEHQFRPFKESPFSDVARTKAFYAHELQTRRDRVARVRATPAYQRADRYVDWTYTRGACAAKARPVLAASAGTLGLGSAGLAGAIALRRRRRAY